MLCPEFRHLPHEDFLLDARALPLPPRVQDIQAALPLDLLVLVELRPGQGPVRGDVDELLVVVGPAAGPHHWQFPLVAHAQLAPLVEELVLPVAPEVLGDAPPRQSVLPELGHELVGGVGHVDGGDALEKVSEEFQAQRGERLQEGVLVAVKGRVH